MERKHGMEWNENNTDLCLLHISVMRALSEQLLFQ